MQIIAIIIFLATIITVMTEKVHRAVAAVVGALLLILTGVLTVESGFSYVDINTIGVLIGMMLFVAIVKNSGIFEYIAIKAAKIAKGRPWPLMPCCASSRRCCPGFWTTSPPCCSSAP